MMVTWSNAPVIILHVILQLLPSSVLCVHISHLSSPSVILGGEELTIDCDFDYQKEEQDQLDLKWYFNSSPFPIYQWVPSMNKGPQVIGELFKEKLDLLYTAHNDTFKKHRALHILNPDHRFSGTYMCKVSSFVDEDFQQKDILVIVPPRHVLLHPVAWREEEGGAVTCRVEGVFPTPTLALVSTINSTVTEAQDTETVVKVDEDGLSEVHLTAELAGDWVGPEGELACEVSIPGTEFYMRQELHLYRKQGSKSPYTSNSPGCGPHSLQLLLTLLILSTLL